MNAFLNDYYGLLILIAFAMVGFAAFVISRVRESMVLGAKIQPLSADDRLRVSLAMRMMEDAERELAKATWVVTPDGGHPGNPRVGDLLLELKAVRWQAIQLLRES